MKVIAVIPARGGSKRVPGKNKRKCGGKPLILWTIEAARGAGFFDKIIVSSDDDDILSLAEAAGVRAAQRPASLSGDTVEMGPVIKHIADAEGLAEQDALILLQPTSPLRAAAHIQEAFRHFCSSNAHDGLVSVVSCPKNFHPQKLLQKDEHGFLRPYFPDAPPPGEVRDLAPAYGRNGPAILIMRGHLASQGLLYGDRVLSYEMEPRFSVDIDDEWDFMLADLLLREVA